MNRFALSAFLAIVLMGSLVSASWPPEPKDISSSNCQKEICSDVSFATKLVCKGFCLGRKRFWQKCGNNGSKGKGSKICNPVLAYAVEKAGKGLIKVTDKAVAAIVKYAG
ncbi:parbolysin P4-like [Lineus longissimus]|uniref:parbolysin P4-like n=1 Tax=Lineus longissimus TaxID=88925 RepID=UPI002B4FA043